MSRWNVVIPAALFLSAVAGHRAQAQAAMPAPMIAHVKRAEPHPRIRSAIRELEAAKVELQKAPHDFGGHRVDAVRAVDNAITQLKLALQYDKR